MTVRSTRSEGSLSSSWPQEQIALVLESLQVEDRHELEAEGWTLYENVEAVVAALRRESDGGTAPAGGSGAWQTLIDDAPTDLERRTLQLLASSGINHLPTVGEEHGDAGLIVDIAWPDLKKGVVLDGLNDDEASAFEAEGWTIVGPDTDDLVGRLGLT